MHTVLVWMLVFGNISTATPKVLPDRFATREDCETAAHNIEQLSNDPEQGAAWGRFKTKCISVKVIPTLPSTQG